jgi:hypothetical protein
MRIRHAQEAALSSTCRSIPLLMHMPPRAPQSMTFCLVIASTLRQHRGAPHLNVLQCPELLCMLYFVSQGTDVKLSGHFVYASVSDMSDVPPLRCTNRCAQQQGCGWCCERGAAHALRLSIRLCSCPAPVRVRCSSNARSSAAMGLKHVHWLRCAAAVHD